MKYSELITEIQRQLAKNEKHLTRQQVGDVVRELISTVKIEVADGNSVTMPGLGVFSLRINVPRLRLAPGATERKMSKGSATIAFKGAKSVKEKFSAFYREHVFPKQDA